MFRFAVLLAVALLMTGPAQADDTMWVKKLKALNACEAFKFSYKARHL